MQRIRKNNHDLNVIPFKKRFFIEFVAFKNISCGGSRSDLGVKTTVEWSGQKTLCRKLAEKKLVKVPVSDPLV